jgi:hypothetical protein
MAEGNVVEVDEIKKILIVAIYLHRKQHGASSSLICMNGFLPLNVCIPFAQSTNDVV